MAKRLWKAIKGVRGGDFQAFLIFLLVSVLIWQAEKLRLTYPEDTALNVVCRNVPEGYVTDAVIEKSVSVRLEGDGFSLLRMYLTNSRNVTVDVSSMPRLKSGGMSWALFIPRKLAANKNDLPEHVRITDVFTDTVMIPLLTVQKKKLPVVVRDDVSLQSQCIYSSARKVSPDSVWITATNDVLDTMAAVYAVIGERLVLGDTLIRDVRLVLPEMAQSSSSTVRVEYDVEPFSEKKLLIPIEPVSVAPGYSCRIFPPNAKVSFYVGLSKFETADEACFRVIADLSNVHPGDKASRVRVSLVKSPGFIQNVSFSPSYAEFILEKKR